MSVVLLESLQAWWPEAILSLGALLVMVLGASTRRSQPALGVAWAAVLASGAALWRLHAPAGTSLFFGLIVSDPFSLALRWIAWGSVAIVLLLLMAFLVGCLDEPRSAEAALKYLLFGALSSGIMLFGMSILFGLTRALAFPDLLRASAALDGSMTHALRVAVALLLAGLAFKISMVPFHMWTPDAYEGAPTAVAALLSVGPKAAGFALLLRLMSALEPAWPSLAPLALWLTILTMTLGNLVALAQTNVKRLLAYSTIGQVGYLLIGVAVHTRFSLEGLLLYLVAYLFMNLGIFACAVAVVDDAGSESLEAFRGLARRAPGVALLCALFLLSLAGIPPLLGFFGKFLLFGAAIEAHLAVLAIAGIINSAVALYYYVNIIRLMYLVAPATSSPLATGPAIRWALGVCGAGTLLLGLFPGALLGMLRASAVVNLL
ncbi:MAG: NADH-quinone oxidoreductase subunit N [Candidatus Omnitrophica bacterium]|nr:NADH-quinone oxidoreductase subunit N [Candidatus Omnitrophota bacterium]